MLDLISVFLGVSHVSPVFLTVSNFRSDIQLLNVNIANGLFQKKSKQGAEGLWHGISRGKDEENVEIPGFDKKR